VSAAGFMASIKGQTANADPTAPTVQVEISKKSRRVLSSVSAVSLMEISSSGRRPYPMDC
jgi:hypothetical protein